jgi:exodeoxyribonuclease-3
MKIIAWNVNGIRAILKKDFLTKLINDEDPDIFCLGETKTNKEHAEIEENITKKLKNKYYSYWSNCKTKNGYSGTVIFTKKEPKKIIYGLNLNGKEYDEEGRVITCEFSKFFVVHVYTPNSGQVLNRLDFRTKEWDPTFIKYLNKLQEIKNVILCGDLNVAHKEIDLKNPKANLRTAGYTIEERDSFDSLLEKTKMKDSFRVLHPDEIKYSYWSYRFNSREKGTGWRIDYFLLSNKLIKKILKSDILSEIYGSDHAPIILIINLK